VHVRTGSLAARAGGARRCGGRAYHRIRRRDAGDDAQLARTSRTFMTP